MDEWSVATSDQRGTQPARRLSAVKDMLPSYGRRRGHKIRKSRDMLLKTLLPRLLVTLPENNLPLEWATGKTLWVEIGFGGGEHLAEQARLHPDITFIGCEPYINGVAGLLAAIEHSQLSNTQIFDGDGRLLLERLPDNSVERLFILFPDPWPKTRHHKRRIISTASLALFYKKLQPSGMLRLVTDHEDYGTWMLEHLLAFGKLTWTAKRHTDWDTPSADWVPTRYQAKAAAEGRMPLFLDWVKHNST